MILGYDTRICVLSCGWKKIERGREKREREREKRDREYTKNVSYIAQLLHMASRHKIK